MHPHCWQTLGFSTTHNATPNPSPNIPRANQSSERLTHEYNKLAAQYERRLSAPVESLGKQVADLEEQVRQLVDHSAQERKAHIEWASTLVKQQQQMGAHVTTLTNEYETLLKSVHAMIDVSDRLTRDIEELSQ